MTARRRQPTTKTTVRAAADPRSAAPKTPEPDAPPRAQPDPPPLDPTPRRAPQLSGMVSVTVPQAYNLTLDDGTRVRYEAGVQDMPRDHADHFYSKANGVEKNED